MQDFSLGKDQSRKSKNIVTWTFFRIQVESFLQKQNLQIHIYIEYIYRRKPESLINKGNRLFDN